MGDVKLLDSVRHPVVTGVVRSLTAHTKPYKTNKMPILVCHLRAMVESRSSLLRRDGTPMSRFLFLRNASLLVIGLLVGLRRRELVALTVGDAIPTKRAEGLEPRIRVRRDKVNQNIIQAQAARTVVVSHGLLDSVFLEYVGCLHDRDAEAPLFPNAAGGFMAPSTVATIVREMLPSVVGVSPHSLRVGCATELFASGVPLATIMEIGRWSTLAAMHYVLPSADVTVAATRSMGVVGGGARVDNGDLCDRLGGAGKEPPRVRRVA